jgi:hypothetical protein
MARASSPELLQRWQQRIQEHIQSGLSVSEYCRIHEIEPYNFYYWRRRIVSPDKPNAAPSESGLVPVRVVGSQIHSQAKIRFASGATLGASGDLMRIAIDQIIVSEHALGVRQC